MDYATNLRKSTTRLPNIEKALDNADIFG